MSSLLNPGLQNCGVGVFCPGTDYPVSNYSSELPDQVFFIGTSFPGGGIPPRPGSLGSGGSSVTGSPDGPTGGSPLGSDPQDWPCIGFGASPISQEDAFLCATLFADTCGNVSALPGSCIPPIWPTNKVPFNPIHPLFYNTEQVCTRECADGSTYTYTIFAGQIAANSQDAADTAAYTLACKYAAQGLVCITPFIPPVPPGQPPRQNQLHLVGGEGWCCSGQLFQNESIFQISSPGFRFAITAGTLPPGLSLFQDSATTAELIGTCSVPGTYSFTLTASNASGKSVSQNYTVLVMGLSVTSLPNGNVGTPYSQTLVSTGEAPVTFALSPGSALPAGLTLASNGTISGTPTTVTP